MANPSKAQRAGRKPKWHSVVTASRPGGPGRGRGAACRRRAPRPCVLVGFGRWRAGLRGGWPRRRLGWSEATGPSSKVHPRPVPMCMPCPPIETAWRTVRVRGKGWQRCRSPVAIRAAWPNPWRVGFSPCRPTPGCPQPTWAKRRVRCARSPSRRLCAAAKARTHRAPQEERTSDPAKRVLGASYATRMRWRRPRGTALESVPSAAWTRP